MGGDGTNIFAGDAEIVREEPPCPLKRREV
jgi:hypothetical protein